MITPDFTPLAIGAQNGLLLFSAECPSQALEANPCVKCERESKTQKLKGVNVHGRCLSVISGIIDEQ